MARKIIALILALLILFALPIAALDNTIKQPFVVGDETYSVDLSKIASSDNAELKGGTLAIKSGGSVTYEMTLPFYSDYVVIKSTSANQIIDINLNGISQTVTLNAGETKNVFITPLRVGEYDLKITAHGNVSISEIIFSEVDERRAEAPFHVETTDYEDATDTAFIVREGSPVLKSNTAIRYIDYNDLSVVPTYINGSIYLPADALAQGFGCYFEEDLSRDFMLLRKGNTELVYLNGSFRLIENEDSKVFNMNKPVIKGKSYLPLRTVAEIFDFYVVYKEGFVICDYRSKANALANEYFGSVKNEFSGYMPSARKGKTYYVAQSKNASDSNAGTIDAPFKTIEKASKVVKAGDTVIIRGGEYSELLKPLNDGTAANPITYKAMPGERVVLTAADRISEFADYENGMVVAHVDWDMGLGKNQVYYNDKALIEGRYPNPEVEEDGMVEFFTGLRLDPLWVTHGDLRGEVGTTLVTSKTLLREPDGTWDGAVFVTQRGSAWTLCSAIVNHQTQGQFTVKNKSKKWWFKLSSKNIDANPNYGYLTCHLAAVDMPGEWHIKDGILYMIPPKGETAKTLSVLVKRRQLVIDLNDRSYVHVEGLETFGGGARMSNAKMCVINNCDMNYISHYTYFKDNRNLFINTADIRNENDAPPSGEVGIYMGGSDNAFINSKINFSAGTGLFIVGSYCYIANNVMNDLCYGGSSCGGIHFDTEAFKTPTTKRGGHTVVYNTLTRVARNAVAMNRVEEPAWQPSPFLPIEIAYNDISDSSICTLDTGMIYLWGSNISDHSRYSKVHNNYVYSTATKGPAILGSIYYDNNMQGSDTYDNLIWANQFGQFNYDIYEQDRKRFPTSDSTVDSWNNINIGIKKNAKADLSLIDFRSMKPFKAGSSLADDWGYDFTYQYYLNGDNGIYYAKDAELSEGVVMENNIAKMTAKEQWIRFKDVDFYGDNYFNVVFSGDYYKDYDKIQVSIGDDLAKPITTFEFTLNAESKNLNDMNTVGASLLPYSLFALKGKHDVWIKPLKCGNSGIYQIHLTNRFIDNQEFEYDYKKIVAGTFSLSQEGNVEGQKPPTPQMRQHIEPDYPILTATWRGGWTAYMDVEVKERVSKFKISAGTSGGYKGNIFEIHLGSPDGEVIARATPVPKSWNFILVETELLRPLEPGKYDLYLTFDGGEKSCSDIHWFGFE